MLDDMMCCLHVQRPQSCSHSCESAVTTIVQASTENSSNLAVYVLAFFLTTMGIVYVQEAERKIPMNYASRYRTGSLGRQSYLPFKVRCTGQLLGTSCTLQFVRVQPCRAPLLVVTRQCDVTSKARHQTCHAVVACCKPGPTCCMPALQQTLGVSTAQPRISQCVLVCGGPNCLSELCIRCLDPPCTQVNATGVMPVIFASSLLAAPTALARYFNTPAVTSFAKAVSPAGSLYLPVCASQPAVSFA